MSKKRLIEEEIASIREESTLDMIKYFESNLHQEQGESFNAKRREDVLYYLEFLDIPYETQKYKTGENIIATIGKDPFVGIGSHYDAVEGSPGANDNASAMAVTLDILKRAQASPLENIGIKAFFFDEEEEGLVGSAAYVKSSDLSELIGVYNMEMVGKGNKIALWEVESSQRGLLLDTIESEARKRKIESYRFTKITNGADHMSFNAAGIKDAFTLTTISDGDLIAAQEYYRILSHNASIPNLYELLLKAPVFAHYHKPTDTSQHLSEQTLQMVSDVLWNSIKEIDKTYKTK